MSGVDEALWDLKGKRAGMPVYELLGGKCRMAAPVYTHASGGDIEELEEAVGRLWEQGFRYIRCQMSVPGYSTYGSGGRRALAAAAAKGAGASKTTGRDAGQSGRGGGYDQRSAPTLEQARERIARQARMPW